MRVLLCPVSPAKLCLEATSEVFEQGVCPFLAKVQTLGQFEIEIASVHKYNYSTRQALHTETSDEVVEPGNWQQGNLSGH